MDMGRQPWLDGAQVSYTRAQVLGHNGVGFLMTEGIETSSEIHVA